MSDFDTFPIASLLGSLVGSFVGIYVLSAILEWAIFQRVMDDPVKGKVTSVAVAFVVAIGVYSFSNRINPFYVMTYAIAAVLVGAFKYRRGLKIREEQTYEEA